MNASPRLLLVDDDAGVRASLSAFLTRTGFQVETASDGAQALSALEKSKPDLVVMDVLMPRLDGRETLRRMRQAENFTPVILLTQVGEATERAMALEEGADDYINKPFEPHELVARIRAVLRRVRAGAPPVATAWVLVSGELSLDRRMRRATFLGRELNLTPKGLLLLEYLMTHSDEVISRKRLLDVVWGWEDYIASRAVDARIAELRRALNDSAEAPTYIETSAGAGYRFIAKVERGS
jgi:DNA-binding response OmpR family regulator